MMNPRRFAGRLVLAAAALLLLACAPQPTVTPLPPTGTAAPIATQPPPSPTARLLPTATPAPTPTTDAYAGWETVETDLLSIRLPAGWQVMELTEADLAQMLAELEPYQEVIGRRPDPAEGAAGLDLVAVAEADGDLSHNLNIRHMPSGAQRHEDARALLGTFAPQMEVLGFTVTEQRADLRTDGGLQMARLSYHLVPTMKGQVEARGEQYYVLTETDVWVLTFTSAGMQVADAAAEFEKSAKTFAPR